MRDTRFEGTFGVLLAAVSLASLSLAIPSNALAQTSTATAAATDTKGEGELETIIVTARRSQELLQDVPISITRSSVLWVSIIHRLHPTQRRVP